MKSPEPLKVLILWADNRAANLGLRVLAQGNAELIRRAFGADNVRIDFQDFGPGDSDVSMGTRSILRDIGRADGPIKSKLRQYDLVVDSGAGDSFADIYGLKRFSFMFYAHWTLSRLRIPVVMGPQTIGPFRTFVGRWAARRMLRKVRLLLVRDSDSGTYVSSLVRNPDVLATDVVFALSVPKPVKSRDVLLNVSGLLWFGNEHVSSGYYRAETVDVVNRLKEEGRTVALIAHVVHSKSGNDDIDACREASALIGGTQPVEILIPESLDEARAILGSARVVIGARMHACLNALSMGTPAIPWAYSRKFAPLMRDIGWTDFGIDLRDETDAASRTIALVRRAALESTAAAVSEIATVADLKLELAALALRTTAADL